MMIGIRFVSRSRFSWSQMANPSMSGSIRSSRIRSGACSRTASTTWAPANSWIGSKPRAWTRLARMSLVSRSSSTISTVRGMGKTLEVMTDELARVASCRSDRRIVAAPRPGWQGIGAAARRALAGRGRRPRHNRLRCEAASGHARPRSGPVSTGPLAPVRPGLAVMEITEDHRRLRLRHLRRPGAAGRLGRVQRDPPLPQPGKKSLGDAEPPARSRSASCCQAGKSDAAIAVCQEPAYWHTALAQLMAVALEEPRQGDRQDQAAPGHGVPHRGHRRDGEPPGVDLDDRADGPAARPARHGGQHDRRLRPDRRRREGQPQRPGRRHQPGALGHRRGPPDRHADDDRRQRHPRQAPPPPRPDRAPAPGLPRDPRGRSRPRPRRGTPRRAPGPSARSCRGDVPSRRAPVIASARYHRSAPCSSAARPPKNATSTST